MATRKATTRRKTTPTEPQTMGALAVRDMVEEIVRNAIRTQARELEQHLQSIHKRLVALEKR